MRKEISLVCLLTAFLSCSGMAGSADASPEEIVVSAAISLKGAFEEIGKLCEARDRGVRVLFNFGASGELARQIEGGAPVDIFASASQSDMDEIEKKGLILQGSRVDLGGNSVVLVVPSNPRARIRSFEELRSNRIKKIAIGNPRTVPAGRYAQEVFLSRGILPDIKEKLVYAENVRQVLDYVARCEVDAGVVYSTDALSRKGDVTIAAAAPENSHRPVVYPIAVVKGTRKEALTREFISLLTSPTGKKILKKYGFRPVRRASRSVEGTKTND